MVRSRVLEILAARIAKLRPGHPVRVGIDGVDASGKTRLADELAPLVTRSGRPVIRASIDGFHNPSSIRYRRGRGSPDGYFLESFDDSALVENLLRPLGPSGSRTFRRSVFDFRTDAPLAPVFELAAEDAVLLLDGVFLHRNELFKFWDYSIFVDVTFETMLNRAVMRDASLLGSADRARALYLERYIPGQRLYLAACNPHRRATLVMKNDILDQPEILDGQRRSDA
jgi:uridine kinase